MHALSAALPDLFDMPALRWPQAGGIWAWTALGCTAAALLTAALRRLDRRMLEQDRVWAKPFHFAFALALHFATFAAVACALPARSGDSGSLTATAAVSALAGAMELAYIALQAARGRHSHFNGQTRWEAVASVLMGVGALLVMLPPMLLGFLVAAAPPPAWPAAVVTGTAAGLLGGTVLTLLTASRMGRLRSRYADTRPDTRRRVRLTGWSLDRADLRPAHFLATHMMQAIPLLSLALSALLPRAPALVLTIGLALGWTALTLHLFRQSSKGRTLHDILARHGRR